MGGGMAVQDEPTDSLAEAAASVDTLAGLAQLLRRLRRTHARLSGGRELTYREIAAKTGWSPAIVGGYLTGTALAPTGRFDTLIVLLGAGPNEQGALATARDRVAEGRRRGHTPERSGHTPERSGPPEPSVPRELPAPVAGFAGRVEQLASLDGVLATGMPTVAVLGTAGVGKTALAVHWAHRVAGRFPDGQLYVNLRGFDPSRSPLSPAEAVRGFLDAFGLPSERIPASPAAQLGLYRSLLADRRVLVVLDNARDADQVRMLLPGGPRCVVVVTSRDHLTGLVAAEGAHAVVLDVLSAVESRDLLVGRLGADRVDAEPAAASEIAVRCANLPLALALVAARAATHPGFPLAALAAELRAGSGGLAAFDAADPTVEVRAVFSWSYRELSADAAWMFRALAQHPGPDIAVPAAASLAGVPVPTGGRLLSELARAHLVTEHVPGRFVFHDLLRAYATELADTVDTVTDRRAARHRMLDHYLHTARAGTMLLDPHRDPIMPPPAAPDVTAENLSDQEEALGWFTAEHAILLSAVELAAATGFEHHAWQLAWSLTNYLQRLGHWDDQIATQTAALAAARRSGDHLGQANSHRHLGRAHAWLGHHEEATGQLEAALDLFVRLGDDTGQAHIHLDIGMTYERHAVHGRALDHSERALHLYRAAGHAAGQANALNASGWVHAQLGNHDLAIRNCEEALALHQEIGDRHAQAGTLDSLGYAHLRLGHHEFAVEYYQRALEVYQETGDRYYQAEILSHLGDAHESASDRDSAHEAWAQALAIMQDLGRHDTESIRAKLSGGSVG
jgi:tetratricopeptide (TPR) repeat protein